IENKLYANIGLINSNLGVLEKRLGNFEVAQRHFINAINNLRKVGNRQGLALVYGNLADLAMATNNFTEAITYAKLQLAEAVKSEALVNQRYAYKHLSKAYSELGNYKEAFKNHQQYMIINDSIMSIDKQKEISRLEAVFQDEKKNEEIRYLESQSEVLENKNRLKTIMLTSVSVLLVLLVLLGATWIWSSKQEAKRKQLLLEHKLLRSQMNPHFLFNSLSTIQNLILRSEKMEAATQVANFSNFIRFILDSSRNNLVSLEKEIEAINLFLDLQKKRFPNLFTHTLNINLNDDPADILVPPLIIQPFVENAIIHGFAKDSTGGLLQVNFIEDNGQLCCRVKDNGVGISSTPTRKEGTHKSVATQITRERLDLLNKRFKTKAMVEYEDIPSNEKGTSILITLPLLFNDNEYK
nr:histidine kinase [Tenuifilaceae bacterium]